MSDELLKRLRTQRTTIAFKNGDFSKTFFDLVDENEKDNPLLFDNSHSSERHCFGYSYKEDVGFSLRYLHLKILNIMKKLRLMYLFITM